MFILDRDIRAGAMRVSSYDRVLKTLGALSSQTGTGYEYYPVVELSGSLDIAAYAPNTFSIESGSALRWHRMSDGTLVGCWNAPISCDLSAYGNISIENRAQDQAPTPVAATTADSAIATYYDLATLDGAAYKVMLQYAYGSGNEWDKYVVPTGQGNWNLSTHPFVTPGYVSRIYGSTKYFDDITYVNQNGRRVQTNSHIRIETTRPSGSIRLVAYPNGTAPNFPTDTIDKGPLTSPQVVPIRVNGVGTVSATIDSDSEQEFTVSGGSAQVDLSRWWDTIGLGAHEVLVTATVSGWKAGCKLSFTKSTDTVSITTKPYSSAKRPVSCRLVGDIVVPSGATLTREVTNNGNDGSPTWESYTGTEHFFSNETKTASQWGLAARISIDNNHGNAVAEIKNSLAMGVLYEGGAE